MGEDLGHGGVVDGVEGHLGGVGLFEVLLEGIASGFVGEAGDEGEAGLGLVYRSFLMPS